MRQHIFTNLIGSFVIDEKKTIVDKVLFNSITDYKNRESAEKGLLRNHPDALKDTAFFSVAVELFKEKSYFDAFRNYNLILTKAKIKASVNEDNLISQAINSIRELDKAINILVKRLREWYSLYNPELSEMVSNNEKFTELALSKSKQEILEELNVSDSMGADIQEKDLHAIHELAKKVLELYQNRRAALDYLEQVMNIYCPNIREIAGTTIGAKLIEHTGSLKRLALLPASTLQILGAEKALFRHIKTGARPPKYGLIFDHQLIQRARKQEQGKRARALADKLTIAARIDYFKGEFIGKKLRQELEEKFQ